MTTLTEARTRIRAAITSLERVDLLSVDAALVRMHRRLAVESLREAERQVTAALYRKRQLESAGCVS